MNIGQQQMNKYIKIIMHYKHYTCGDYMTAENELSKIADDFKPDQDKDFPNMLSVLQALEAAHLLIINFRYLTKKCDMDSLPHIMRAYFLSSGADPCQYYEGMIPGDVVFI